jgi:isopentenyl diphosphate isomerase/L-lactate dehydrogenase-like FMN-dependent dehydrogenase
VVNWLEHFIWEVKVAIHCVGTRDLDALHDVSLVRWES